VSNQQTQRCVIRCSAKRDDRGQPEEFTNDLSCVTEWNAELEQFASNGLPKVGTRVRPGMLLIGKLGQKRSDVKGTWNKVRILTASEIELRDHYSKWLYNASYYAPEDCSGIVTAAYFEDRNGERTAVVEIKLDQVK
jgi:DNA-directed RNA polymerase beta subunit